MTLALAERSRLSELEGVIGRGLGTFIEVGKALAEIRESRLYRETHKTFELYCREKWGWSRSRANRLIAASEIGSDLVPMGTTPASERAIRPLLPLSKPQRQVAWSRAAKKSGGPPTARAVEAEVEKIRMPGQSFSEEMVLIHEAVALIRKASGILTRCADRYGIGERGAAEIAEALARPNRTVMGGAHSTRQMVARSG